MRIIGKRADHRTARIAAVVLTAGIALSASLPTDAAGRGQPLDPTRRHFGTSYEELTGDWWNWAVQFPLATNPILENGRVDCSRGQSGKIWFLAGNFGGAAGEPNPSDRTCRIQPGKALFFPVANTLFWAPEDGDDVDEVRRIANDATNAISELEVTVDGRPITDLFGYRAQSPPGGFALRFGPLLADFGFDPAPDPRQPAVADGYWILLAPLRNGVHELHIRASDPPDLNIEVTYRPLSGTAALSCRARRRGSDDGRAARSAPRRRTAGASSDRRCRRRRRSRPR
jgi:hypothetical protein